MVMAALFLLRVEPRNRCELVALVLSMAFVKLLRGRTVMCARAWKMDDPARAVFVR